MTAWRESKTATAKGQPDGRVSEDAPTCTAWAWAELPRSTQARTRTKNAAAFKPAEKSCVLRPQLMPRHCKTPKPAIITVERILIFHSGVSVNEEKSFTVVGEWRYGKK